MSPTSGFSWYL